jgi:hypothetical protein
VIECPYCQTELEIPEDLDTNRLHADKSNGEALITCTNCERELNVLAQQAYARGCALYLSVREEVAGVPAPQRAGSIFKPAPKIHQVSIENDIIRTCQQAYSGLQVAFQFDLPDEQRENAIEMMAEMTRLFLHRERISPLEASYWTKLMIEQTARHEYKELEQKLSKPKQHRFLGFLRRWRWQLRYRQLAKALVKLDEQIRDMERLIGFSNPPHARRRESA